MFLLINNTIQSRIRQIMNSIYFLYFRALEAGMPFFIPYEIIIFKTFYDDSLNTTKNIYA